MKNFFLLAAVALFTLPTLKADDTADAQALVATMQEYQKTDDARSPDLYARDCTAKFVLSDGKNEKAKVYNGDEWRAMLAKMLALKHGSKDVYEDVKYTPEGTGTRMTATIVDGSDGKRAPYSMLLTRDDVGALKIKEFSITFPVAQLP